MDIFDLGRIEGFPSQYSSKELPVTIDVTETILFSLFTIIAVACLSIVPGNRKKQSIYVCVKLFCSIAVGCALMAENFGQEWEVGFVKTRTPYRAGEPHEIQAAIRVKIGLRSVNVTLKGEGNEGTPLAKETIDYNERFWWIWDQGKFGFGPNAGLLQRNFRGAQRRGAPIPILNIVEYFTIDGEGIRFGRFYRTAGWFCHILLWAAFAWWILANIQVFVQTVGRYAAYSIAVTGSLQLLCCIVWIAVHNPAPLVIPFEDGIMRVKLGLHFWITLICGLLCIIAAVVLVYMDLRHPDALSAFLGVHPLTQYDECIVRYSDLKNIMSRKGNASNAMEMTSVSSRNDSMMVLKRRSTIRNVQKSLYLPPVPMKLNCNEEDDATYENEVVLSSSTSNAKERGAKEKEDSKPLIPKKVGQRKVLP